MFYNWFIYILIFVESNVVKGGVCLFCETRWQKELEDVPCQV